jgi:hypothetical protein
MRVEGRVVPHRQQAALVDLRQLQRELDPREYIVYARVYWRSLQEGRATLVALERLQRHGAEQQRQAAEQLRQGIEQLRSQEVAQQEIQKLMVDAMQSAQVSTQAVEAMRLVQQRAQHGALSWRRGWRSRACDWRRHRASGWHRGRACDSHQRCTP